VKKWITPGIAVVAAAAVTAAVLAFASGGKAASPSVCTTASSDTTMTKASCVSELVAPHVLTVNADAVSITSFINQSGVGGATAARVVLSVKFPSQVTVKAIKVLVNGTVVSNSCTPTTLPALAQTVSCSVGSIIGGDRAKMIVRFSTATGGVLEGAVSYGEGGNDSSPPRPNGTVNDTQKAWDTLAIAGASAAGDCFDATQFLNGGHATVSGSTTAQATTASVGQATTSLSLPCTPASAGVDTDPAHRPLNFVPVSFAEFPTTEGNVPGTVTIDFLSGVPKGFVLKELQLGKDPTDPNSWSPVPTCASNLSGSDSCIVNTKNLPKGGLEYNLNVFGSNFDPSYSG